MNQKSIIELYSDDWGESKNGKKGTASRSVWASIERNTLTFEQQDIGPLLEEMFGNSDYERVYTVSLPALKSALAVKDEELLSELKKRFNTSDAFDKFREFISDNNIEVISFYFG
jgi:hypothetical protein